LILDTKFLVDAERDSSDLDDLIDDDDDVAVAAITVAELRVGALIADRRRRSARNAFVDNIVGTVPVIDYDIDVAEAHASLLVDVRRQGRPRGAHDLIIAATAKASERAVVTADRAAFADLAGIDVRSHR
jgi:tRNA(fMet)-specific endonuclease VapC